MLSVLESQAVGVLIEAMLYGIYLVTVGACIAPRFYQSVPGRLTLPFFGVPWFISFVTMALFIMSTANLYLGLVQCLGGSSLHENVNASLPRDWVTVVRTSIWGLQVLIADCSFIYRCRILYFKSWSIIVFPIIVWIVDSVCLIAYIFVQALPRIPDYVAHRWTTSLLTGAWGLTIVINIYITTVITARILYLDKRRNAHRAEQTVNWARLQQIVIESGLLYTCSSIFVLVTVAAKSKIVYIAAGINVQVLGIAVNLLLIRLAWRPNTQSKDQLQFAHTMTSGTRTQLEVHIEFSTVDDRSVGDDHPQILVNRNEPSRLR